MRVATAVSGRLDLLNDSKFSQGGDAQSASQSALGRLSHSSFACSKTSRIIRRDGARAVRSRRFHQAYRRRRHESCRVGANEQ